MIFLLEIVTKGVMILHGPSVDFVSGVKEVNVQCRFDCLYISTCYREKRTIRSNLRRFILHYSRFYSTQPSSFAKGLKSIKDVAPKTPLLELAPEPAVTVNKNLDHSRSEKNNCSENISSNLPSVEFLRSKRYIAYTQIPHKVRLFTLHPIISYTCCTNQDSNPLRILPSLSLLHMPNSLS